MKDRMINSNTLKSVGIRIDKKWTETIQIELNSLENFKIFGHAIQQCVQMGVQKESEEKTNS